MRVGTYARRSTVRPTHVVDHDLFLVRCFEMSYTNYMLRMSFIFSNEPSGERSIGTIGPTTRHVESSFTCPPRPTCNASARASRRDKSGARDGPKARDRDHTSSIPCASRMTLLVRESNHARENIDGLDRSVPPQTRRAELHVSLDTQV